jgi:hypothetical protein
MTLYPGQYKSNINHSPLSRMLEPNYLWTFKPKQRYVPLATHISFRSPHTLLILFCPSRASSTATSEPIAIEQIGGSQSETIRDGQFFTFSDNIRFDFHLKYLLGFVVVVRNVLSRMTCMIESRRDREKARFIQDTC